METIEAAMARNSDVYPNNNGNVTGAEVARIAQIHPTTLFSPKQIEVGALVSIWVDLVKITTRNAPASSARRTPAEHIADWKFAYENLRQNYRVTELELQEKEADCSDLGKQLAEAIVQNGKLDALVKEFRMRLDQASRGRRTDPSPVSNIVALRPQTPYPDS